MKWPRFATTLVRIAEALEHLVTLQTAQYGMDRKLAEAADRSEARVQQLVTDLRQHMADCHAWHKAIDHDVKKVLTYALSDDDAPSGSVQ